jgi:hypothetical protein
MGFRKKQYEYIERTKKSDFWWNLVITHFSATSSSSSSSSSSYFSSFSVGAVTHNEF